MIKLPVGKKPVYSTVPVSIRIKEAITKFRKTHKNALADKFGLGSKDGKVTRYAAQV